MRKALCRHEPAGHRYRYYACCTRQRYGVDQCKAERLPADDLETAILGATLQVYERTNLFKQAVAAARLQARAQRSAREEELSFVEAEVTKAEEAIERYLGAFEADTLTESLCGAHLERLGAKIADLRRRREDLMAAVAEAAGR